MVDETLLIGIEGAGIADAGARAKSLDRRIFDQESQGVLPCELHEAWRAQGIDGADDLGTIGGERDQQASAGLDRVGRDGSEIRWMKLLQHELPGGFPRPDHGSRRRVGEVEQKQEVPPRRWGYGSLDLQPSLSRLDDVQIDHPHADDLLRLALVEDLEILQSQIANRLPVLTDDIDGHLDLENLGALLEGLVDVLSQGSAVRRARHHDQEKGSRELLVGNLSCHVS